MRRRPLTWVTLTAEGESVEITTVGVYELPKLVSAVIAAGNCVAVG